jgi:tetratricopeptide (TPR) repeat protein
MTAIVQPESNVLSLPSRAMAGPARTSDQKQSQLLIQQALKCLDQGLYDQADEILRPLATLTPQNPDAIQLLGVVRRLKGRPDEAEALYRQSLSLAPHQPHVHHNLGNLLRAQRRLEESAAAQKEAIRLKPNYVDAHLALALALSELGDHAAAEASCRAALRIQPNFLPARQALVAELNELDRPKEAETVARAALSLNPRDVRQVAALEHNLALALKQQERFDEALQLFDAAQARVPDLAAVDYNRANTFLQLGRLEDSARAYGRAVQREPAHIEALAGMALTSALLDDFTTARDRGNETLARDPGNAIALIALAIVDAASGAFADAAERLRLAIASPLTGLNKQIGFSLGYAADALDRRGRHAQAFEIYQTSNALRRRTHFAAGAPRVGPEIDRLSAYFSASAPWSPSPLPAPDGRGPSGHVFILGFMRSGTTLLQTILSANPAVVSIDEIEFLTGPAREFLLSEQGLDRLSALGADDTLVWQNAYWKAIRDTGLSVGGKIFIDKMPFNSLRLPLIAKLFPKAKAIFAIRDPRDVVISCFRRRFNPTPFSYEFMDLTDCAKFYTATMALTEIYREKLAIDVHDYRYEDVVEDFDSCIGAACRFTGIDWTPAMRDFSSEAEKIDRRSPSASQVRRGLYREGVGQWRNYREQLRQVDEILQPWVKRFGYPSE